MCQDKCQDMCQDKYQVMCQATHQAMYQAMHQAMQQATHQAMYQAIFQAIYLTIDTQVCEAAAQAGRCLLSQQAGILAGSNAGMAAYVAAVMGARMEVGYFWIHSVLMSIFQSGVTIAMATTNLSPELLGL